MKLHRFIDSQFDLYQKTISITNPRINHQLEKVLRKGQGDKIILGDGRQAEALVTIKSISKNESLVFLEEVYQNNYEPETKITLFVSILKKDKMEWLAEKVTEIGVFKIVPVVSQRTVKPNLRLDRLKKIIIEAAEQSGRGIVPEVEEKLSLEEALKKAKKENDFNFFFHTQGDTISSLDKTKLRKMKKIGVFIGPEGGFSEEEISLVCNQDILIVKMSDLVFRGETAAILASFLTLFILD